MLSAGTDFFLPRAQGVSVSSPNAAKAVGSAEKPQQQSQTKDLPATWMQHFCDAVLLYERNVVGLEGDSLFRGGKSELRVTVAHSSQWAELQSYQGYAAQARMLRELHFLSFSLFFLLCFFEFFFFRALPFTLLAVELLHEVIQC